MYSRPKQILLLNENDLASINSKNNNSIKKKLSTKFSVFSHSAFRYYWIGLLVSLIGTWMQQVAQSWLVYKLTNSPLQLGLVGAIQFLPLLLFSLFAGVIIDHFPKKKIIIITQIISMSLAFILSALVFFNIICYWHIICLAFILGVANSLDMPSRQAYIIELVGRKDLVNAVALNSSIFNLARVIGPFCAGIVMVNFGMVWCFVINGLSFLAFIYSLYHINTPFPHNTTSFDRYYSQKQTKDYSTFDTNTLDTNTQQNENKWSFCVLIKNVKEGIDYIINNEVVAKTIFLLLAVGIFGFNFNVYIPILAKNIFNLNEQGLGILWSALGIGSLIGALTVKSNKNADINFHRMSLFAALIGLHLVLLGLCHSYQITIILLITVGITGLWFATMANSTLQLYSKDQYRGRVMSAYTLVFAGTTPIGNFLTGLFAERISTYFSFALNGILLIISVTAAWYFLKNYQGNKRNNKDLQYNNSKYSYHNKFHNVIIINFKKNIANNHGHLVLKKQQRTNYLKSIIKPLTKQVDTYTITAIPINNERKNKYNISE